MKSQSPDLIHAPEYIAALELLAEARVKFHDAVDKAKAAQAKSTIRCCHCAGVFPISTQTYIQTHWYTQPHGCTGGDYWNQGEANWECPVCKYKNRFEGVPKYGTGWMSRPDIIACKSLFLRVRDCYCRHSYNEQLCDDCKREAKLKK